MAFPEPVKTHQLPNLFAGDLIYDPERAAKFQAELAGTEARAAEARMRTRVDEMRLAEMAKQRSIDEELLKAGENLFQATPTETKVTPGPEYQSMMRNLLGEDFPYEPGIRAEPVVETPYGPMKRSAMEQLSPEVRGRMMLEKGKADVAKAETMRVEAEKIRQLKITSADKHITEFIKSGDNEALQSYLSFMAKDPDLAPVAAKASGLEITGGGEIKGERFFNAQELAQLDPGGKMTGGIPGVYNFERKGAKRTFTRKNMTRDLLVNSAINGTPEEQQWARDKMTKAEEMAPHTTYADFAKGEIDKMKREPDKKDWTDAMFRNEAVKRWQKAQMAQKQQALDIRVGAQKEQWTEEVKKIGDAMIRGDFAPEMSNLGRGPQRTMLLAYLADKGFDMKMANEDWLATKKWITTVNSAPVYRLRSAIDFAYESLELVDKLAKEWNAGPYPLLNKAAIVAAKNNMYGEKAMSLATMLDLQITDLQAELATVYRSGNSPTNEALKNAEKMLASEWSLQTLMDATELSRINLEYRKTALRHTGPAGMSATATEMRQAKEEVKRHKEKKQKDRQLYALGGPKTKAAEKLFSPKLGRDVTNDELSATAKKHKISVDEVKKRLEIK